MGGTESRGLAVYLKHHLLLLTLVLAVLGVVMLGVQRRTAPDELNPWVDTGCDLSRGACRFLPDDEQQVLISGDLEHVGGEVWGRFDVVIQKRRVDTVSLQIICIDPAMQHATIPMDAGEDNHYSVHSRLPECREETRLRQVRVLMELEGGQPLAVSFQLSG